MDDNASVARAEVEDEVLGARFSERQHARHDLGRGGEERRPYRRLLRGGMRRQQQAR